MYDVHHYLLTSISVNYLPLGLSRQSDENQTPSHTAGHIFFSKIHPLYRMHEVLL